MRGTTNNIHGENLVLITYFYSFGDPPFSLLLNNVAKDSSGTSLTPLPQGTVATEPISDAHSPCATHTPCAFRAAHNKGVVRHMPDGKHTANVLAVVCVVLLHCWSCPASLYKLHACMYMCTATTLVASH